MPIPATNQVLSFHHSLILLKSSCSYFSTLTHPHFYRPRPKHPHYYAPKPPQSATPRTHSRHAVPKRLYKSKLCFLSLSFSDTPPSHHHLLRPLQTMQIFSLHRSCFSPICMICMIFASDNIKNRPLVWYTALHNSVIYCQTSTMLILCYGYLKAVNFEGSLSKTG